MTTKITTCFIWGEEYSADGYFRQDPSEAVVYNSDRGGGGYIIPGSLRRLGEELGDEEKARLTTWLVDQRLQGNNRPTVTEGIVEYVVGRPSLPVYERAEKLLRFMSEQTVKAGESVFLFHHPRDSEFKEDALGFPVYPDVPTNPIFLGAMAWSESTSREEVSYLVDYLEEEDWVRETEKMSRMGLRSYEYRVTVRGHGRIAAEISGPDSSQAFVAMWFDDSVRAAYDEGIEPAICDSGYKAKRIDRDLTVDKIDDAIISEIRRSRFLVADFTHGKQGARGGVYYEAGFALGLGIPVIFTCRRNMIDEIHFDTRQYAHVLWDNASDLKSSLRDRILARIGEGPKQAVQAS